MISHKISVRGMVEFILRSGDINAGFMSANRALEGTRLHQKIQKRRKLEAEKCGLLYESEYVLKLAIPYKEFLFQCEGRADGVETSPDGNRVVVEEIKSTFKPIEFIENDPRHWHWAQLKCYGSLLCELRGIQQICLRLTYGHIETEEIVMFEEQWNLTELKTFFIALVERYYFFAALDATRIAERNETARVMPFPHGDYRIGQRELCVSVYTTIKQRRKLFAQAPTGTGKTISVLFPAVKALANGLGEKIFYCTAKAVTRGLAEKTLADCAAAGLRVRAVTLYARDKICPMEKRKCDASYCPYAAGHFDRVNDAILQIISCETLIDRPVLESYSEKYQVCPFEFSLDVSLFCDVVVCDYNHVYDPKARLKRYFINGGDFILLHDEAHNLVERARDMFSATLRKEDLKAVRKTLRRKSKLYKLFSVALKVFSSGVPSKDEPKELYAPLRALASEMNDRLTDLNEPVNDAFLDLYFAIMDFLRIGELFDSRYIAFWESSDTPNSVKLYCLDPSHLLAHEAQKSRAAIFFSATLTPAEYYKNLLGGTEADFSLRLRSPFAQNNLGVFVDTNISTLYKDRRESFLPIAKRLNEMTMAKPGNYLAFFSSYEYLNAVCRVFCDTYPEIETFLQTADMTEENREDFLSRFEPGGTRTQLAFAVLGGLFSEGIDLQADRLIGAAIVGVGLPMICADRNVIADYYTEIGFFGFSYAYQYPGMNKVMQAAGRVIRSETDRGVVLLIDSRFSRKEYFQLFPPEWSNAVWLRPNCDLRSMLYAFWSKC